MNFFVNLIKKANINKKLNSYNSNLLLKAKVKYYGMDVYFFNKNI
jgi:hypothetical protein